MFGTVGKSFSTGWQRAEDAVAESVRNGRFGVRHFIRRCSVVLLCGVGLPAWGCGDQATTDLEKAFCRVKSEAPTVPLPSFREFQKNPEKTQRLLLKRPARKLGIKLPPTADRAGKPATSSIHQATSTTIPKQASLANLPECSLQGARIRCSDGSYQLQRNRPNRTIPADVLRDTALKLPAPPVTQAPQALSRYLTETYKGYIYAMLEIGLAEVTLSYTKYNHIFQEVQQRGGNFPERMSTMFEYLKKDKQQMSVGRRSSDVLPQSLEQCQRLDDRLVLCDNVAENWIFQHTGR